MTPDDDKDPGSAITITDEDSRHMHAFIERVVAEVGPRMPCSPQEAEAAGLIKGEMAETCDEVALEPFTCHPRAFLGWIRLDVCLILASAGVLFSGLLASGEYWTRLLILGCVVTLNLASLVIMWKEFFNYEEFIDGWFARKTSQNVVGRIRPPDGDVKRVIIFSGHHDSALQFNLLRYLKVGYGILAFLGLGIMFLWIGASVVAIGLAVVDVLNWATYARVGAWLLLVGSPALVALFFFVSPGERANKVPGAVDNLSAVAIVLGVGRYLKAHPDLLPPHTEVRLISFGCEEAGLRGASRYVARHHAELATLNAETVNLDGIESAQKMMFFAFEPTTRTTHSPEVTRRLVAAAQAAGVPAHEFGHTFKEKLAGQISGGTDATAFSKAGLKAGSVGALTLRKGLQYYHQPTDTPDKIDPGALENALKVCLTYLRDR